MSDLPATPDPIRKGWTSASNALSDSLCPGRHLAQRGLPDTTRSEDAASGDRIHRALAATPNAEDEPRKLSLEDREVFDKCREQEKALMRQFFGEEEFNKANPFRVFRHQRFWAKFRTPDGRELEHSGEVDVLFRGGLQGLIIDYKTGRGDVADSPRNLQLRDLAVLVRGNHVNVTRIGTAIVQPFVTDKPEICVYEAEDLQRSEMEMFQRVDASNNPSSVRVAGEVQCKFCLAKPHCAVYQRWAGQIVPIQMLGVLEVPLANWTPAQRAQALNCVNAARKLLTDIEAACKEGLARDPAFVPGWKLKPGSIREAIIDPQTLFARFGALGGKAENFMKAVIIQKGKLREVVNEVTAAKGEALDKAVKTLTDGLVRKKQTAPSLVKDGDASQVIDTPEEPNEQAA